MMDQEIYTFSKVISPEVNVVGWLDFEFFWGCSCGVMVKVLDSGFEVSEFKHQSGYYIHFWTNTPGKRIQLLYFHQV